MCGIAGIVGRAPIDPSLIDRMLAALAHRGPDDAGLYVGDGATLGYRRLSIIDLGSGHQPLHDASKTLSLVANGIFKNLNDKDLAESMVANGLQRVAEFSWKKCAAQTLEAIREAARAH